MEKSRRMQIVLPIFLLFSAALACNLPGSGNESDDPTNTPVPESSATPVNNTPTATIVHTDFPSEPSFIKSFVNDRSTKSIAGERRANADNFSINLLERPFTSEAMDYLDYLDITRGELSLELPWLYLTIFLEGSPP